MTQAESIEILVDFFNSVVPLNEMEKELVRGRFTLRKYRKRQFVLQEGDVCKHYNFVVEGCLRMYKINEQGNIHIVQFASENNWVADLDSFYNERASSLSIDVLENATLLQITRSDIIKLYLGASKFDRIFRVLTERYFFNLQRRLLSTMSVSAEEHYQNFVETYPHLLTRLPQTQIAAFLGVTPEFLSRLKSKQLKQK